MRAAVYCNDEQLFRVSHEPLDERIPDVEALDLGEVVVLVPGLVGQAHRGVVLEMVLELNLHMIGVVAERGIAGARIAVVIAADGKRRVFQAGNRRRIPQIGAAIAIAIRVRPTRSERIGSDAL